MKLEFSRQPTVKTW